MGAPLTGADGLPYWVKDPDAVKDYTVDWTAWLAADTISTSNWFVSAGLTVGTKTNTNSAATQWLSGGVKGKSYRVTNRIATVGGRTEDRSFNIVVKDQ